MVMCNMYIVQLLTSARQVSWRVVTGFCSLCVTFNFCRYSAPCISVYFARVTYYHVFFPYLIQLYKLLQPCTFEFHNVMVLSSIDAECKAWLQSVLKDCGAEKVEDMKPQAAARLRGTYLTSLFCQGVQLISKMLGEDHVMQRDRLHEELIASQKTIIDLQKQLIQAKDEQLKSVTSAVEWKVDELAKEVRDYSAAVKSHVPEGSSSRHAGISSAEVRTAVKTALLDHADEEGRDCNVVLFGLKEEKLCERVKNMFKVMARSLILKP